MNLSLEEKFVFGKHKRQTCCAMLGRQMKAQIQSMEFMVLYWILSVLKFGAFSVCMQHCRYFCQLFFWSSYDPQCLSQQYLRVPQGISPQPQFKLRGISWRCWQTWVCTNRRAVNSSSVQVDMHSCFLCQPRTLDWLWTVTPRKTTQKPIIVTCATANVSCLLKKK